MSVIVIATDGATLGNPGPSGWAWVRDDGVWESAAIGDATNNIAELTAILEALNSHTTVPLRIETDSQYAVKAVTQWASGWKRRGWQTSSGEPVKNRDLIEAILAHVETRTDVEIVWVRGHNGHILNEWADRKASDAADKSSHGITMRYGTLRGEPPVTTSDLPPGTIIKPRRKKRLVSSGGKPVRR